MFENAHNKFKVKSKTVLAETELNESSLDCHSVSRRYCYGADILRYTFLKYTSELSTKVYSSIEVDTKVYLTSILRYTLI